MRMFNKATRRGTPAGFVVVRPDNSNDVTCVRDSNAFIMLPEPECLDERDDGNENENRNTDRTHCPQRSSKKSRNTTSNKKPSRNSKSIKTTKPSKKAKSIGAIGRTNKVGTAGASRHHQQRQQQKRKKNKKSRASSPSRRPRTRTSNEDKAGRGRSLTRDIARTKPSTRHRSSSVPPAERLRRTNMATSLSRQGAGKKNQIMTDSMAVLPDKDTTNQSCLAPSSIFTSFRKMICAS